MPCPLGTFRHRTGRCAGVSRTALSANLSGRAGKGPEKAVRLSLAVGTTSGSRVLQQAQYDLWHAEPHRHELTVRRLAAA